MGDPLFLSLGLLSKALSTNVFQLLLVTSGSGFTTHQLLLLFPLICASNYRFIAGSHSFMGLSVIEDSTSDSGFEPGCRSTAHDWGLIQVWTPSLGSTQRFNAIHVPTIKMSHNQFISVPFFFAFSCLNQIFSRVYLIIVVSVK